MGWASKHIEKLLNGETVQFRPVGHSMNGRIRSRQLVTVEPFGDEYNKYDLKRNDIVLCRVNGNEYLHLIKAIRNTKSKQNRRYQIGNNRGHINGWIGDDQIFGLCTNVE